MTSKPLQTSEPKESQSSPVVEVKNDGVSPRSTKLSVLNDISESSPQVVSFSRDHKDVSVNAADSDSASRSPNRSLPEQTKTDPTPSQATSDTSSSTPESRRFVLSPESPTQAFAFPPSSITAKLCNLRKEGVLIDSSIFLHHDEFPCHSAVVSLFSDVLKTKLFFFLQSR
ncbi:hypothetical protein GEMRC1_005077 [Eukaryota sp. GEM-RC1]